MHRVHDGPHHVQNRFSTSLNTPDADGPDPFPVGLTRGNMVRERVVDLVGNRGREAGLE